MISKTALAITQHSYLEYARYVNSTRSLVDIRDGLKTVQRRILITCKGINKKAKCAQIVGECMAKYHPHGDASVYGALVNLVRNQVSLLEGQGSFGTQGDDDGAAAMRYTGAQLNPLGHTFLELSDLAPKTRNDLNNYEPDFIPTPFPYCLHPNTKIKLLDGRDITIEELSKEEKDNFVFSSNLNGSFEVSKVVKCIPTKKFTNSIRITLDNNEIVESSEDHLFLLRDGTYKEAQYLQPNDSLMPGYTKLSEEKDGFQQIGYSIIKDNYSDNWQMVHYLSDNYNIKNNLYNYDISNRDFRHHKDFTKLNNNPTNIQRVSSGEHHRIHSSVTFKKLWEDPVWREKKLKELPKLAELGFVKYGSSLEGRKQRSITIANLNRNPDFHKKSTQWQRTDKGKEIMSQTMRTNNLDPLLQIRSQKGKIFKECVTNKVNSLLEYKSIKSRYSPTYNYALSVFESEENFTKEFSEYLKTFNHKIIKIERISYEKEIQFYDIEVDSKHHNFLLGSGIVVHNSLLTGARGIGVGVVSSIPPCTIPSMVDRLRNGKSPIIPNSLGHGSISVSNSELERFNKEGKFSAVISAEVSWEYHKDEGKQVIVVKNIPLYINVYMANLALREEIAEGMVYVRDESTDQPRIVIARRSRIRKISDDDLFKKIKRAYTKSISFTCYVWDNGVIRITTPGDFLQKSFDLALKVTKGKIEQQLGKVERDLKFEQVKGELSKDLLAGEPKEYILSHLGITNEELDDFSGRSITALKKVKDTKELSKQKKTYEGFISDVKGYYFKYKMKEFTKGV